MSPTSTLGFVWLILTATIGHAVLVYGALKFWQQYRDDATRGIVERQRDVAEMSRMREGLTK